MNSAIAQTNAHPASFTQEPQPADTISSQPQVVAPVSAEPNGPTSSSPSQPNSEPLTQVIPQRGPTFQQPIPATPASSATDTFSPPIPAEPQAQSLPKLKGAGIIQRAISQNPKAPRHVLLAPNGRILAYLQAAAGVNLDQHLGRPMGIEGLRLHRPELQMNVFLVQSLEPVTLR